MFADRKEAGQALAAVLDTYRAGDVVVLALPRGGVPVGYEIARALEAPLDVIVVRKLGAPDEPELGVGAVVDGDHPQTVINQEVVRALAVSPEYLANEIQAQLAEIRRRQEIYRKGRPAPQLAGRTVIVVDDGIATGGTVRAALRGVRRAAPAKLVLATPVAPLEALESLRTEVDDLVCLETPSDFEALGQFYYDFRQVSDEEVIDLLERANSGWDDAAL
jgi:putative phosphoribosyl transferase